MGRDATGAQTCENSKRLDLSYLLKRRYLVKGETTRSKYYWTTGGEEVGSIMIISVWNEEIYLRLRYSITDQNGNAIDYDERIDIVTVPSNLGNGKVLYFKCPVTRKRCRLLYLAYGSHKFASREAYKKRIYYSIQTASKRYYSTERIFKLEKQLQEIYNSRKRRYYNNEKTRTLKRVEKIEADLDHYEGIRTMQLSKFLGIHFPKF